MRSFLISAGLCLAVVAVGVAAAVGGAALRRDETETVPTREERTNVAVEVVEPQAVEDGLQVTGRVIPWKEIVVSAEVSGRIEWQGVEAGDKVAEGDPLFRIDRETIQAQVDQAQAEYNLAVQELERIEGLRGRGVSSPRELDQAVARRAVAAAALRAARVQLSKSEVAAEFDGVVDDVMLEEGEFVDRGAALLRLVQLDRVKVEAGVPERDIRFVTPGQSVAVQVDALAGRTFQGKVHHVAATAERSTRTFPVEVALDNSELLLRPGMLARVRFVRHAWPDAILVPFFAVINYGDRDVVFVEEDGVARSRVVETGIFKGASVQVVEGLEPGDRVIVAGQRDLSDGEPVQVREAVE